MSSDPGISGVTMQRARDEGRAALVGYLSAGYPDLATSTAAMTALCAPGNGPGVDLVEVGLPYSDPMMDGSAIQRAGGTALSRGFRTKDVFGIVSAIANTGTPAVVMTYWNLVERYGVDAFARDLAAAGGAGLITPDLVPDEADEWVTASDNHGLDRIFLVAPSSSDERIAATTKACRGWVYATAVMGVTGTRSQTSDAAPQLVRRVRELSAETLVGVGLGVSNGRQAASVADFADGVIVGSALIKAMLGAEDAGTPEDLTALREVVSDLAMGVRSRI